MGAFALSPTLKSVIVNCAFVGIPFNSVCLNSSIFCQFGTFLFKYSNPGMMIGSPKNPNPAANVEALVTM